MTPERDEAPARDNPCGGARSPVRTVTFGTCTPAAGSPSRSSSRLHSWSWRSSDTRHSPPQAGTSCVWPRARVEESSIPSPGASCPTTGCSPTAVTTTACSRHSETSRTTRARKRRWRRPRLSSHPPGLFERTATKSSTTSAPRRSHGTTSTSARRLLRAGRCARPATTTASSSARSRGSRRRTHWRRSHARSAQEPGSGGAGSSTTSAGTASGTG
jgi:hypothetical protein